MKQFHSRDRSSNQYRSVCMNIQQEFYPIDHSKRGHHLYRSLRSVPFDLSTLRSYYRKCCMTQRLSLNQLVTSKIFSQCSDQHGSRDHQIHRLELCLNNADLAL
jgi:hypothetical protein